MTKKQIFVTAVQEMALRLDSKISQPLASEAAGLADLVIEETLPDDVRAAADRFVKLFYEAKLKSVPAYR